jgi:hypothetical protein
MCWPNCRLYTQTSKKLCYQTREGLRNSSNISSSQDYLAHFYSFEVPQTSNPFSLFPPSIKTHHPSPPFPKKNNIRRKPYTNSFSPSFSCHLLELILIIQWKLWKSFSLIHGLLIFQVPMKIKNDLPSNGV